MSNYLDNKVLTHRIKYWTHSLAGVITSGSSKTTDLQEAIKRLEFLAVTIPDLAKLQMTTEYEELEDE
jgi:hypothetical protein